MCNTNNLATNFYQIIFNSNLATSARNLDYHQVLFLLVQTGCLHEMAVVYVAMTACYFHFQALFTSFLLILPYVIDKINVD